MNVSFRPTQVQLNQLVLVCDDCGALVLPNARERHQEWHSGLVHTGTVAA